MSQTPLQVLIVDDSAVVRGLLAQALESDPEIEVAGTAMHGQAALAWLRRHKADVVILDVEMPVMDGLAALEVIQEEFPGLPVVMASTLTHKGAQTTIRALALGAAGCIAKPTAANVPTSIAMLVRELVPLVKSLGRSACGDGENASAAEAVPTRIGKPPATPQLIVIGASTGGPKALSDVLRGLSPEVTLPILVVQHMPPMFTPILAQHLASDCGRPCREAIHGEPIQRGRVYVAPGDHHLIVAKGGDRMILQLTQAEPEHFCRPSVNPLFRTAAQWYGKTLIGVMLTGMGSDGLEGARELVERGGYLIAQDEATSVVWGMPGAVVEAGLAHCVAPLKQIPAILSELCTCEAARS